MSFCVPSCRLVACACFVCVFGRNINVHEVRWRVCGCEGGRASARTDVAASSITEQKTMLPWVWVAGLLDYGWGGAAHAQAPSGRGGAAHAA